MADGMSGFDLVDEPWLPLRDAEGPRLAGLRDALTDPERFTGIDYAEIDEFFGLLRLMTVILNRAFEGPRRPSDWEDIAYGDGYDVDAVHRYLDRWRDRFGLFHPTRPFLQYPELAGEKDAPANVLTPMLGSGNAVTLFSHVAEVDARALTPAQAARALVHVVLNGRGSLKGGEYGIFGARVAIAGATLRELLVENLPRHTAGAQDGIPVWERDEPRRLPAAPRKSPQRCVGLMDLSTWQWRAVLLRRDEDGLVRRCVFGPAPKPDGEEPTDPARWYRTPSQKERERKPDLPLRVDQRLRPDRDVWRDADALVAALADRSTAGVLSWNVDYRRSAAFDVLVGGPLAELKGSWVVTGVRAASLPIPKAVLADAQLRTRVAAAVELADQRARTLYGAAGTLARELARPAPGDNPTKKRVDDLLPSLNPASTFWPALPAAFVAFLRGVTEPAALDDWRVLVDDEARRALRQVVSGLAATPRGLRAAAAAERYLEVHLRKESPVEQSAEAMTEVVT